MIIEVQLTEEDVDRIASRVAALIDTGTTRAQLWLDVAGAAHHLALTDDAIRGLVKRRRIPFHRMENGRLRFAVAELDQWVRTGTCESSNEDLP
jgi:excisionase family DNA binding protein